MNQNRFNKTKKMVMGPKGTVATKWVQKFISLGDSKLVVLLPTTQLQCPNLFLLPPLYLTFLLSLPHSESSYLGLPRFLRF